MGTIIVASFLFSLSLVFLLTSSVSSWESVNTNSSHKLQEPRFNRYANIFNGENNASLYFTNPFAKRSDEGTDPPKPASTNETSGRALDLEALFGEASHSTNSGDRESRIVNEKPKINIQGFIPIISMEKMQGINSHGHQSHQVNHQPSYQPPQQGPVYHPSSSQESYETQPVFPQNSPGYGYAGPEHGKQAPFGGIGAALQNLAVFRPLKRKYGSGSYQQELTPGVDCLCVPFYMCKRGFLEASTAKNSFNNGNPNQYQNQGQPPSEEFIRQQFAAAQSEASSNFASAALPPNLSNFFNQDSSPGSSLPQPFASQQSASQQSASQPGANYDSSLPLDERSVDPQSEQNDSDQRSTHFPSNETHEVSTIFSERSSTNPIEKQSAAQYSRDTMGRMIGGSGSSCGVLRTCCRIAPEFPPQHPHPVQIGGHPNNFHGHHGMESIPYPVHGQRPIGLNPHHGAPPHHHQGHQSNLPQFLRPGHRKPNFALPHPGSLEIVGASFMKPKQPYGQVIPPFRPQFNGINKPYQKPINFGGRPHHINRAINLPYAPPVPSYQSIGNPYPSQSLSVPTLPYQANNHLQPSMSHGQCGARSSNSVQGRVQNLNYHESSAEFGEYPWMAALLKRIGPADSLYVCGAVLISPQWVLTAAHCIKENRAEDLKLRFGEWDVHRDDEYYPYVERFVTDIVIHPEFFQGNLMNDIALMRFDSPVEFNSPHIASACLPEPYDNLIGHRCWVTGWGKNSFGQQGEYQSVLKEVDLPVVGPAECEQALRSTRLGPYYQLHPGFMCAGGEGGKDACEGDGGSPLVCEVGGSWKVAGLVSWGIGCGQPGIPGVYANVGYYRQWIDSNINKYARESSSNSIAQFLPGIIQERSNSLSNDTASVRESRSFDESTGSSTETPTTVITTSSSSA